MGSISKGLRPFFTNKNFTILHSLTPIVVVDPNVLSNTYHPLNRRVLGRIRAAKTNEPQLIITALAPKKNVSKYSVVRNKAVRRVREAVYGVLRVKGYGRDGRLLKTSEEYGGDDRERLVGTLSFSVTMDTVITPWDDLKGDVEAVIDKFIVISQKVKGAQAKNTYRGRPGPECGYTPGSRRFESSAEEAWVGPSHVRSLGREKGDKGDKSGKGTIIERRHPQGQYTAIAIGQGLQQKMGSGAGRAGGRPEARTTAEAPSRRDFPRENGGGWGRPVLDVISQRSKQTPQRKPGSR